MRRVQSAIVIIALLAIPVALPARTGPCAQSKCSRMCDLILRSVRAEHMRCTCGMMTNGSGCRNSSSKKQPDYGLNAPMAPTIPSPRVLIGTPASARRGPAFDSALTISGFRPEMIQPPRA
jgi:hypothetical protein